MKKGLFTFAFALLYIFSFGQTIHKGSLLGVHILAPNLKEGVTMQDYANFYMNKWIPEVEKAFPGVKAYLLKSVRGEDSSGMGVIYIFNSEADRNKYWTTTGATTAAGEAAVKAVNDKLGKDIEKYETTSSGVSDKFNDWVVQ
jgi:hypothetical protein